MANLLYLVIGFVGVAFTGNIYSDDFDPDEVLSISNKAVPALQVRLNEIGFADPEPPARGVKRKRSSKPNAR